MKYPFQSTRLAADGLVQSSAMMLAGVGGGQAVVFISTLLLARIFSPEAFGDLAQYMAIITIISVVASCRYEIAIPAARDDAEAFGLVRLGMALVLLTTGLTALFAVLAKASGLTLKEAWSAGPWVLLLPLGVYATGSTQVLSYWHTRTSAFDAISRSLLVRAVGVSLFQLAFGVLLLRSGRWLIAGFILGQMLAFGSLWRAALPQWRARLETTPSPLLDTALMKRHSDYLRFGTGQVLVNAFSQSLPVLGLTYLFDLSVAGQYSMAYRVLMVPVNVVAGSIRQVIYRVLSDSANRDHRFMVWRRTTLTLLGIGLVPLGIIVIWGPQVFEAILGDRWYVAGEYARWLSPWLLASLVNPPSVVSIPLLGLQRMHLHFELSAALIRVAMLVAGGYWDTPLIVIAGFGIIGFIVNLWLIARVGLFLFRDRRDQDTGGPFAGVDS